MGRNYIIVDNFAYNTFISHSLELCTKLTVIISNMIHFLVRNRDVSNRYITYIL